MLASGIPSVNKSFPFSYKTLQERKILDSFCKHVAMSIIFVLAPIIILVICRQCLSQVEIRCPPRFLYPVKSTVLYILKHDRITLNCSATGNPPPRYKWLRNGTEIYTGPNIGVDTLAGTLHFNDFSRSQEDFYRCLATVDFDNGRLGHSKAANLSPTVRMRMVYLDSFSGPDIHVIHKRQYEYLSIPCGDNKTSVASKLTYDWYHKSNNKLMRPDGGRIFVDNNGTLHYIYLALGDDTGNETIACGLSTRVGAVVYVHHGHDYQVKVSPLELIYVPTHPPGLQYSTRKVIAQQDTSAVLECVFSGFDVHGGKTRQWWRMDSGQPIPNDKRFNVSVGGQRLTILNVSQSDEATYECVGNNSYGQRIGQVVLDVTSVPLFVTGPPEDMTVIQGRDAEISCNTRSLPGDPPPDLPVWFINGEKVGLQYDTTRFHIAQNYKHLKVLNVQKLTDIMCVQCEVTNNVGTVFARSCLHILLPIIVVSTPPEIQKIRHGDRINLTAIATTDPTVKLHYRWEFGKNRFDMNTTPSHIVIDSATMEVYINTSMLAVDKLEEVAGHYNIVIYHDYETKVLGTTVIISVTIQETTTASVDPLWSEDYTYIAIAVIVPLAILLFILLLAFCALRQRKINAESEEEAKYKQDTSYVFEERFSEDYSEIAVESAV